MTVHNSGPFRPRKMQQHEQRRAAPPPSEYAVAPPTASAAAAQQTQPQHTPFFLFPKSMCTFHGITFTVDPRYTIRCHVGQGAQGVIWSAVDTHSPTQKEIAVKKMPNALDEVLAAKRLLRELRLLRHLKHENIVALLDIMLPPSTNVLLWKDVYAVYDLMDTDLEYVIKSGQEITNDHVKYFSAQLLSGIAYLHRCQVVHRDLKPGNILIDRDCRLKICDFGLARSCAKQSDNDSNQLLTMYVTTRWYRAPELLCFNTAYGEAVDMWSAGCIVAELLLRRPLFQGTDPLNQLEQVVQLIGRPSEADLENVMNESALQFLENLPQSEAQLEETLSMASASAIELIRGMLRFNPETRISADEALRHPYLEEYAPDTATADAAAREELAPALLSEWLTITGLSTLPMEQLQNLIFQEMLHFHPEATALKWGAAQC